MLLVQAEILFHINTRYTFLFFPTYESIIRDMKYKRGLSTSPTSGWSTPA